MAKWKKAPRELVELFERAVPDVPDVEKRQMFGYPCTFVNGNMFMGLFEDKMFVRLGADGRPSLLSQDGTGPLEPMKGRPMKEYVVLSDEILADSSELERWIELSFTYVLGLPPKEKKQRKRGARKSIEPRNRDTDPLSRERAAASQVAHDDSRDFLKAHNHLGDVPDEEE